MACHKQSQVLTFTKREDTTLPADNPMTALSTYGTPSLAPSALALLSAWLALRADDARWRSGHPQQPSTRSLDVRFGGALHPALTCPFLTERF